MDLRQLHYFICVAEYLNISHAAQKLMLSQSTLSRSIRALEEELGAPLFDRQNNVITLTRAGSLFLKRARELISLADSAQSELLELTSPEKIPIRLVSRCIRQIMYTSRPLWSATTAALRATSSARAAAYFWCRNIR